MARLLRIVLIGFFVGTGLLVVGGVAASNLPERLRDGMAQTVRPYLPFVSDWLIGLGIGKDVPLPPERPSWQDIPLKLRLSQGSFRHGQPVFIRILKRESVLELFMQRGDGWRLFQSYPICAWSGSLGPKLREGDGQSPEGFYEVTAKALNPNSNYHLSFNLGFPNAHDRAHGRTGSFLMVHGACSSIGCYAMTDAGIEEIYGLVEAALKAGQGSVPVHAFPFRMSEANLTAASYSPHARFWRNLAEGWTAFEQSGAPPLTYHCAGPRYGFAVSRAGAPAMPVSLPQCRRIGGL